MRYVVLEIVGKRFHARYGRRGIKIREDVRNPLGVVAARGRREAERKARERFPAAERLQLTEV